MKRRTRPEVWLLAGMLGILGLWGVDTLAHLNHGTPAEGQRPALSSDAEKQANVAHAHDRDKLPRGTSAPDFQLPDASGKLHRLSEYRGETLVLSFFCGCARCSMMANVLADIREKVRGPKPRLLAVTTMEAEALPRWAEKTGYHATFLLEKREGPVMAMYEGDPCPRVYVVDRKQRIAAETPTPELELPMSAIMNPLAEATGSTWRLKEGEMPHPGMSLPPGEKI